MVSGFGSVGELFERKLIPEALTAYRRFRFVPRPAYIIAQSVNSEWEHFARGAPVPQYMNAYTRLYMESMASTDTEMYYGRQAWEPSLVASTMGHISYTSGISEAECYANPFFAMPAHPAPDPRCTCGFWAYYTADDTDTGNVPDWSVLAAVQVSGDVVLGTKGVRAQRMRILGVMPPWKLSETDAMPIVKAWQSVVQAVGVPQYGTLAELLEFHPPQDVSELVPRDRQLPGTVGRCFCGEFNCGHPVNFQQAVINSGRWSSGYNASAAYLRSSRGY